MKHRWYRFLSALLCCLMLMSNVAGAFADTSEVLEEISENAHDHSHEAQAEEPVKEKNKAKSEAKAEDKQPEAKFEEKAEEAKSEDKAEDKQPEAKSEDKAEEAKSEEKAEDKQPEDKSEEKAEEVKSEDKVEDKQPEAKSEDKAEEAKSEEKAEDKQPEAKSEDKAEEATSEEKAEDTQSEEDKSEDKQSEETQPEEAHPEAKSEDEQPEDTQPTEKEESEGKESEEKGSESEQPEEAQPAGEEESEEEGSEQLEEAQPTGEEASEEAESTGEGKPEGEPSEALEPEMLEPEAPEKTLEDMPCVHENRRSSPLNERDHYYYGDGPSGHIHQYRADVEYICDECGEYLGKDENQELETFEPHAWDENGHCTLCGYDCVHDGMEKGVCQDCGYHCPHEFDEYGWCHLCTYTCEHQFKDGVCTVCGYHCPHDNYSDGVCVACGQPCPHEYEYGVCRLCGQVCEHQYDEEGTCKLCGYVCEHHYAEGVCEICGRVCPHDGIDKRYESAYTYEVIPGDNRQHMVTYRYWKDLYCWACGQYMGREIIEENEPYPASHYYGLDGVCQNCGYTNTCNHENGTNTGFGGANYRAESIDGLTHRFVHDWCEFEWCNDCGAPLKRNLLETRSSGIGRHSFEDGVCRDCGYVCPHENPVEYKTFYITSDEREAVDEHTHRVTGHYYVYQACPVCSVYVGDPYYTEDEVLVLPHDFDSDNYCPACGYTTDCQHESQSWVEEARPYAYEEGYEDRGDDTHVHYRHVNRRLVCDDCGRVFEHEEGVRVEDDPQPHVYDENGICVLCFRACEHYSGFTDGVCDTCGYRCPHDIIWIDEGFKETYDEIPGNDNAHTVRRWTWQVERCGHCGQTLRESERQLEESYTSGHEYDADGVCELCGHVNACQHANAYEQSSIYNWDEAVVTPGPAHSHTHTVSGLGYRAMYCPDCGMSYDVQNNVEVSYTAGCDYEDGVCLRCGAACEHEETSEFMKWPDWSELSFESLGAKGHITSGVFGYGESCFYCGMDLSLEHREDSFEQRHDYGSEGGNVCIRCGYENTCPHTNAQEIVWIYNYDEAEFTSNGPDSHTVTGEGERHWYCPDCEQDYGYETNIQVSKVESHSFEDGLCVWCGESCPHRSVGTYVHWSDDEDPEYASVDDRVHRYRRVGTEITACEVCGYVFGEEPYEDSGEEGHAYNDEGVCEQCGHVCQCEHENAWWNSWIYDLDEAEFSDAGREGHNATGLGANYRYCPDCGRYLQYERDVEVTRLYGHEYTDGVCERCGRECQHDDTYTSLRWPEDEEPQYASLNNRYHTYSAACTRVTLCSSCDITLREEPYVDTETEEHNYGADGVCKQCGHKNDCEHKFTWSDNYFYDEDEVEYTDNGSNGHTATGLGETYVVCEACGMELERHENVQVVRHLNHDFEDGVCERCGFKCEHPHTWTETVPVQEELLAYTEINDVIHVVSGEYILYQRCTTCGERVSQEVTTRTFNDTHEYNDEGVCEQCGHVNNCPHVEYMEDYEGGDWDNPDYTELDDYSHTATIHDVTTYKHCGLCGMRFDVKHGQTLQRTWSHSFDESNFCTSCGYECKHTHGTYTSRGIGEYSDITYATRDVYTHTRVGEGYENEHCLICDSLMSEKAITHSDIQRHNFRTVDGEQVCVDCGYSCDHSADRLKDYLDVEGTETTYECYDSTFHWEIQKTVLHSTCASCGEDVREGEAVTRKFIQWHNFTTQADGTMLCQDCGFWIKCAHGNTYREGPYLKSDRTYQVVDGRTHTATGDSYYSVYCADCGELLGYEEGGVITREEQHEFYQGRCEECGALRDQDCVHAHTVQFVEPESGFYDQDLCDDYTHTVEGDGFLVTRCEDCGRWLDEEYSLGYSQVEDHNYQHGVCVDCSHVCGHPADEIVRGVCQLCGTGGLAVEPTDVALDRSSATVDLNQKLQLAATIAPVDAETALSWTTSDANVAAVDGTGLVTAKGLGTATITVKTDNSLTAACKITVVLRPASVELKPDAAYFNIGDFHIFTAAVAPANANADTALTWTVADPKIASCAVVDGECRVTALSAGKTTLTVRTANGKTDSSQLIVRATPTGLKLSAESASLLAGETLALKATVSPSDANNAVYWSTSALSVATVNTNGLVKAVAPGTAIITGKTINGITATCKLTVSAVPTSVQLSAASATLFAGSTLSLTAQVLPANAVNTLTWTTSDAKVATVNGSGLVTAVAPGTATITAKTVNGLTATCAVTVPVAPTSVKLGAASATVYVGQTLALTATVLPANAVKTLTWTTSNAKIATVDGSGLVKAVAAGTATITAKTANGLTATCKITVPVTPTSVKLSATKSTLVVGKKLTLKATIAPSKAVKTVTWSSSNAKVASVDGKGVVTALKKGSATITAKTANGLTATCKVTVPAAPTKVSLNKTKATVVVGASLALKAKLTGSGAKTELTWSSSNKKVADVDENGVVTAKKKGSATITVKTANGLTATCKVTVPAAPTKVKFAKKSYTVKKGKTLTLAPTLTPSAAQTEYTWSTSDKKIATVSTKGVVKGVKKGSVTIIVKTANGKTASVTVTVK